MSRTKHVKDNSKLEYFIWTYSIYTQIEQKLVTDCLIPLLSQIAWHPFCHRLPDTFFVTDCLTPFLSQIASHTFCYKLPDTFFVTDCLTHFLLQIAKLCFASSPLQIDKWKPLFNFSSQLNPRRLHVEIETINKFIQYTNYKIWLVVLCLVWNWAKSVFGFCRAKSDFALSETGLSRA